ncbi:hypothetical protein QR680_002206 [Steinernema hermaphroditum]|uniref:VHS domain-containing protein n=1 Tax=Steinernema hermaphroditum TaxID=289476 RepID=A0AA39H1T8_9BILA|nr:hypothetical protein QR680_002206 [Steinernema hermaphroditum]
MRRLLAPCGQQIYGAESGLLNWQKQNATYRQTSRNYFHKLMNGQCENGSALQLDKPLEYFLAAATNPYITEDERNQLATVLCEKIGSDLEGAAVAVKNLSHKILSPDQSEALIALNIIDKCVRSCGQRVWNEIAKFRFLNQLVRLLSPKYMGLETSDAVRNRAIELLFTWKNSMRHLGKIEEVYALLKEQGVIQSDPVITTEIPNCPKPSRLALFEDEEKAHLLSELLKSKNPDDLQAANRLIKSMVRSEDLRMERITKRRECIEKAEGNCRVLSEMLDEFTVFSKSDHGVMKELYDDLLTLRPMMFRYAGEAAENNDEALADVLSVNDAVNKTIQRYKSVVGKDDNVPQQQLNGTEKECLEQVSTQLELLGLSSSPNRTAPLSSGHSEVDDDALIGLSLAPSPAALKKRKDHCQKEGTPKSSLDELLGTLVEKAFSPKSDEPNRPKHLTVCGREAIASPNPVDPFSPMGSMEVSPVIPRSNLDNVSLGLTEVSLNHARSPLIVFDENNIKIVLYLGECARLSSKIHPFVACVTNTNCYELREIRLILASSSPGVDSRLLPTTKDRLSAFSPLEAQQNICQILLLDAEPLMKQNISMRFAFGYAANGLRKDHSGEFQIEM